MWAFYAAFQDEREYASAESISESRKVCSLERNPGAKGDGARRSLGLPSAAIRRQSVGHCFQKAYGRERPPNRHETLFGPAGRMAGDTDEMWSIARFPTV